MEGLGKLNESARTSQAALAMPVQQWRAADAVAELYRYLSRYFVLWSGADVNEQKEIAKWVLAANKVWRLKSTKPLPAELEQRLLQRVSPSGAKIKACAEYLGVQHKLVDKSLAATVVTQRRPYQASRDGPLGLSTKIWHKQHSSGKVIYWRNETGREVVGIAFDKGRTAKLVVVLAGLEVAA